MQGSNEKGRDSAEAARRAPAHVGQRPSKLQALRHNSELTLLRGSDLFDADWYLVRHGDVGVQGKDPLRHYVEYGAAEGRQPSLGFDPAFYLGQVPGVDPGRTNLLCHYLLVGEKQGLWPNAYFDPQVFARESGLTLEAGGGSLLGRYLSDPGFYGVRPSRAFDGADYLRRNDDVRAAGMNPLAHYLHSGRLEPWRFVEAAAGRPASSALYRVERQGEIAAGEDVVVFAAYAPEGRLSAFQKGLVEAYGSAGYRVILCVNAGVFEDAVDVGETSADLVIVRENLGFDFGAWAHACALVGGLEASGSVSFANDSVAVVGGPARLREQREAVRSSGLDVAFATRNHEIREHLQSYFFALSGEALKSGALSVIADTPAYADKDTLIEKVELNLAGRFSALGLVCGPLYVLAEAEASKANPTIRHWEALLDQSFPYFKIQLITSGLMTAEDPRLPARLGGELATQVVAHVGQRHDRALVQIVPRNDAPPLTPYFSSLYNEYGAQTAANPPLSQSRPVLVPLADAGNTPVPSVLVVIHCFYMDVAQEILQQIADLGFDFRLLLTTDSQDKADALAIIIRHLGLRGHAVVTINRGRDVGPFLIECERDAGDEELILHLHTKKSLHDSRYGGWGEFLRENLIGSREIVQSIFALFASSNAGIVYSEHFPAVAGLRNWGYDFEKATSLLKRLGIEVTAGMWLEFPTSTMFWIRRSVLAKLMDLKLAYEDFDPEAGQIDGTLAHAIERCFLYLSEGQGRTNIKVVSGSQARYAIAPPIRISAADIGGLARYPAVRLLDSASARGRFVAEVAEVYPVTTCISRNPALRLNILLPTLQPEKIYGGITTALKSAQALIKALPSGSDVRIVVTSDLVDRSSLNEAARRLGRTCVLVDPHSDIGGLSIVGLAANCNMPLNLRESDVFFATAWWTADLAFRCRERQVAAFGCGKDVVYLIQDYEPGFYAWSDKFALAEATYNQPGTFAIINSEELSNFMADRYRFSHAVQIPYELNETLFETLKPTAKEAIVLCYGRPSVSRNCFSTIVEGIRRWQERRPSDNLRYRVVFAGEAFDAALIADVENAEVVGKMSLAAYAEMLGRAAIGVSLMVSPHPSYPPLEMASAGCITITNSYESKDLGLRSKAIISIDGLRPEALADALDEAMKCVRIGEVVSPIAVARLKVDMPEVDYLRIVAKLGI